MQPSLLEVMFSVCTDDKNCLTYLYKNNIFHCEFWDVAPYRITFSTDDSVYSWGQLPLFDLDSKNPEDGRSNLLRNVGDYLETDSA